MPKYLERVWSTASGDLWVKVNKGSKVKPCDNNNIKSMRSSILKLYNVVASLNISVEFDQEHPLTFGSRSTRGQRSNLVNSIYWKFWGLAVSYFTIWLHISISWTTLIDSIGDLWVKVNKGSKVTSCEDDSVWYIRPSLKLCNLVVCLNILVEYD